MLCRISFLIIGLNEQFDFIIINNMSNPSVFKLSGAHVDERNFLKTRSIFIRFEIMKLSAFN